MIRPGISRIAMLRLAVSKGNGVGIPNPRKMRLFLPGSSRSYHIPSHLPGVPFLGSSLVCTLPQLSMEAHRGLYIEDSSLIRGPSPLPC